jgi:Na+/H+ antiporter NhaC
MPGMEAFVRAIPINLYAVLTIVMVVVLSLRKNGDYGSMLTAELKAENSTFIKDDKILKEDDISAIEASDKGRVFDLIIPVVLLIIFCITAMLYYGGAWEGGGKSVRDAFADTDAGMALSMGGLLTIIMCFLLYVPRRVVGFKDFFATIVTGIKAMVSAMVILTLAWTIGGVCKEMLQTGIFVAEVVKGTNLVPLIPALLFLCGCGIAFATGTSWGTFGILIPISVDICNRLAPELSLTCLAAVMGGAVFGDHSSPISDTTILSSTGAGCKHIDHVTTQMPYALTVATAALAGYVVAGFTTINLGFTASTTISFVVAAALLAIALIVLPKMSRRGKLARNGINAG